MLSIKDDRLDYGQELQPPEGFQLDIALATTYSLDLGALVAASLALHMNQTLEGDISSERLALLECLDQLQGRLLVFHQSGCIHLPGEFNRLFSLLEPLLVPCMAMDGADGAYASFHPKVWLMRFCSIADPNERVFRLVVLSRNLTFDRSWDVAVALDGTPSGRRRREQPDALQDFLRTLPASTQHASLLDNMRESLSDVVWDAPPFFDRVAMLPGHGAKEGRSHRTPFASDLMTGRFDELLVVSPFLDVDPGSMLQHLALRTTGSKTLISRADTLDAVRAGSLDGWQVQRLRDAVVDGEERLGQSRAAPQNLHAKLVVVRVGKNAYWHIGSANMTNAAFGKPGKRAPRNQEFMLRLDGANNRAGPAALMKEWSKHDVFTAHVFAEPTGATAEERQRLRRLTHQLVSCQWRLQAQPSGENHWRVELSLDPEPVVPPDFAVSVGLLCRDAWKPLASRTAWDTLRLTEISAFVPVEISGQGGTVLARFSVQARVSAELSDARRRAVFKETVGSREKLLSYLHMLLDSEGFKGVKEKSKGGAGDMFGIDGSGGLYERLLRAAARAPERIARALHVWQRARDEGVELPEELAELFTGFEPFGKRHPE